ncbi:PAAR domain-containing protein [Enterobacter sp. Bisph1]|uniref:PAAR domain-containing protein n=1 Tax=Enterobacter sp. Bisph1 TaxID=1274399 RepID=UPI00057C17D3|nr:PAAR domain-containing protein [Enterobacter sp. Bisph1]
MNRQYNNELTPELLAAMEQSPFTTEQLTGMNDETRALIAEKQAYCRQHPVNAIYRIAVDGSLTRESGTVRAAYNGNEIELSDGRKVNVALVGDDVVYPDGRTAKIVTGAGKMSEVNGRSVALVNSRLDNGDEIISTLCNGPMIVTRTGETMPEDFLFSTRVA